MTEARPWLDIAIFYYNDVIAGSKMSAVITHGQLAVMNVGCWSSTPRSVQQPGDELRDGSCLLRRFIGLC